MATGGQWGTTITRDLDLLRLTQWLSPSFPLGSFAYSSGLETAMTEGSVHDPVSLTHWLAAVLRYGTGHMDAVLLLHAMRGEDVADLARALAPSRERLEETMAQGTAFAATVNAICEGDFVPAPFPVVVGQVGQMLNQPEAVVVSLYLQALVGNLVAAAVRFIPLGQTAGQAVLYDLHAVMAEVAQSARQTSLDELGSGAFMADMEAFKHEELPVRIFKT
ncbi:urease accessory protein UreF [Actibacterium sp. 188UL27-1]|uniref:urease accessory protein UreF n=1 Tax=Actibacterium sp. 188UL27-1 TaxID=2786961 RepID=UPI0019575050|nr:urease accessory UreF family protein [Actibacterium sp. 188UL27-1]MBM7069596.1 urease accessory protein UreF [Actibacterium sp. 188UL27-1]